MRLMYRWWYDTPEQTVYFRDAPGIGPDGQVKVLLRREEEPRYSTTYVIAPRPGGSTQQLCIVNGQCEDDGRCYMVRAYFSRSRDSLNNLPIYDFDREQIRRLRE